jgi:hypothetical protein
VARSGVSPHTVFTAPPWIALPTWEQQEANQALNQRRLRIAHVNSHVKHCRIVKDRLRLWQQGIRALVMGRCCTLHHFRVRLTPWTPMM